MTRMTKIKTSSCYSYDHLIISLLNLKTCDVISSPHLNNLITVINCKANDSIFGFKTYIKDFLLDLKITSIVSIHPHVEFFKINIMMSEPMLCINSIFLKSASYNGDFVL